MYASGDLGSLDCTSLACLVSGRLLPLYTFDAQVIRALAAWVAAMTGTHTKTHMEAAANGIVARLLAAQAGGHVATVSGGPDSMSSESKARTDALYNIATTSDTFIQLRKLARRASAVREGVNASEAASTAPGGAAAAGSSAQA